jgi:hypothetical protein
VPGSRGGARELAVVLGHEHVPQVAVRALDGADAVRLELFDQAILQGAVDAFAAAAGLGGVGQDVLDTELVQCPPDLRPV